MRYAVLCFPLVFSFIFLHADDAIRALSEYTIDDAHASAIRLYAEGDGTPEDFVKAYDIFLPLAEEGNPVALYYCGHMHLYGRGVQLEYDRAWNFFQQAAAEGVGEAYGRLGYMEEMGLGREKNNEEAARFYQLASEADPQAMNNLGTLIIKDLIPGDKHMAVSLLEKASAAGNANALNNLGYFHAFGKIQDPDPAYGLRLLRKAADMDYIDAISNLYWISRGSSRLLPSDKERRKGLIAELTKMRKEKAEALLHEVVFAYQQGGIEAGLQKLDDKNQMIHDFYVWSYFYRKVWGEAQTRTGRENPEWDWRVFDRLYHANKIRWEAHRGRAFEGSVVLGNLAKGLIADGRIGLLQGVHRKIEQNFKEIRNIDLTRSPQSDLNYGNPQLPRYDRFSMPIIQPRTDNEDFNKWHMGKPIYVHSIGSLEWVSYSEFFQGNWREALAFSVWQEKWCDTMVRENNKKIMHHRDFWQVAGTMAIRTAEIYRSLGFIQKEQDYLQKPIAAESKSYKSRLLHLSRTLLALRMAENDMPITEDLDSLTEMRQLRADNIYDTKRGPYEVDLVIATKYRQDGDHAKADDLLRATLEFARKDRLFVLHIMALRMRILWSLEDQQLDRCESDLLEILEICRHKGLMIKEPELYHLYAQVKALQGELDRAIELQLSAIDLYVSIDLYTWLPLRYLEVAQWYRETGNEEYARYYAGLARDLLSQTDAQYPNWIFVKSRNLLGTFDEATSSLVSKNQIGKTHTGASVTTTPEGTSKRVARHSTLDMQPRHLVSIPLASKPALGLFTLTNFSEVPQAATLVGVGQIDSIKRNSSGDVTVYLSHDQKTREAAFDLEVEGAFQEVLYVMSPADSAPMDLHLKLLQEDAVTQHSMFRFPESDQTTNIAVTNASEIHDNPYYLMSIFHVLQRLNDGADDWVNLRFKATAPTRIEGYNGDGALLFVDADGDGQFISSGDVLRADANADGIMDVVFENGFESTMIEIRVEPKQLPDDDLLKIEVQRYKNGVWHTDAVNNILFTD